MARAQLDQNREWLELLTERLTGRRIPVRALQAEAVQAEGDAPPPPGAQPPAAGSAGPAAPGKPVRDLRAEAMSSSAVQAMLEVFPAELGDVEEV